MHSDMLKKIKYTVLLLLLSICSSAQTIDNGNALYNEYLRIISTSGETITAYNTLYHSYEQYWGVLIKNDSDFLQAKEGLKTIFPSIRNGIYFFASQNQEAMVNQFTDVYIEISMNPSMQNEQLPIGSDYGTLAWLAATYNWNSKPKQYQKAIRSFQAYINSGDAKNRAEAYYRIAKSYENLDDTPHALYALEQGLTLYPDNQQMLALAINILGENKSNDVALQKYITKMMKYKPNDKALINIQAQLYERTKNYEQAAITYQRLRQIYPQNLDIARHLSLNYYNAGVVYANKVMTLKPNSQEAKGYKQEAITYFTRASKVLEEVLYSDPLAINYAYALAKAYAYIGDKNSLQSINSKLQALGYSPASASDNNMQEMAYTKVSAAPNLMAPVPNANTYANNQQTSAQNQSTSQKKAKQIKSDVDINIPVNKTNNTNTFAVIIANERYNRVADVPNAENDGNIFSEYCNKVLGIPSENIRNHRNVTLGGMLDAIEDMKAIASAKHGDCKFIFYYAGHGVPDEKTNSAYILPVDADGKQMRICYSLSSLYSDFSALNAKCVTVFMDACFSGATRNIDTDSGKSKMLSMARSVEIDVDDEEIDGNVVVFSAVSNNQTALSYDDKNHGMFTYFLLKKLKETKGDVDLEELSKYIIDEVSLTSQLKNRKQQTPTVASGYALGDDWKNIKLK